MHRNKLPRFMTALTVAALTATGCSSTNQTNREVAAIDGLLSSESELDGGGGTTAGGTGQASTTPDTTGNAPDGTTQPDTSSTSSPGSPAGGRGGATSAGSSSTSGQSDETEAPATAGAPGPSGSGPSGATPDSRDDVAMGVGVTADTITIGFQAGETGAAFAAVGAGIQPAYESDMARALVAWLNDTGGIRGRKVVGAYHDTETTQGTWASQAQQTCAALTEDANSFAVISSAVGGDDSLAACLNQKKTPLFELNTWIWDQDYFDKYPDLYRPGHLRAEDGYTAYIEGLQRVGYFDGATVGLLRFDAPVFDRMMDRVLNPTLARLGVEITEQVIGSPNSVSDFGGAGAEMANAVLRFRAAGVTHVIMVENAGIMPFFFLKEAESQGFRPTYGFSTIDIPETQSSQGDPNQLNGAVAIGWAPPIDATRNDNPNRNASFELCEKILTDGGVENMAGFYAQSRCDAVFLLRAGLEAAPTLTPEGLRQGIASIGTKHVSPFTIETSYAANKRWGARTVRPLAYDNSCECFKVAGPDTRVA